MKVTIEGSLMIKWWIVTTTRVKAHIIAPVSENCKRWWDEKYSLTKHCMHRWLLSYRYVLAVSFTQRTMYIHHKYINLRHLINYTYEEIRILQFYGGQRISMDPNIWTYLSVTQLNAANTLKPPSQRYGKVLKAYYPNRPSTIRIIKLSTSLSRLVKCLRISTMLSPWFFILPKRCLLSGFYRFICWYWCLFWNASSFMCLTYNQLVLLVKYLHLFLYANSLHVRVCSWCD
jgi:hypothetical protein